VGVFGPRNFFLLLEIPDSITGLQISEDFLDFGEVWAQGEFLWAIEIRNNDDVPIEILEFISSCECLSVTPGQLIIPPNSSGLIELVINLLPWDSRTASDEYRPIEIHLTPLIKNSPPIHSGWRIRGLVHHSLKNVGVNYVLPDELGEDAIVDLNWEPFVQLENICVETQTPFFIENLSVENTSNTSINFRIKSLKPISPGAIEIPLFILIEIPDGTKLPIFPLVLKGSIGETIRATPNFLHLGILPIGNKGRKFVAIRSSDGREFQIEDILLDDDEVRGAISGNAGVWFERVSQNLGENSTMARIIVRDMDEKVHVIEIGISYYGI
jgi:hypothetical protein